MAAHCLARYRFRGSRSARFLILSRHDPAAAAADPVAVPDPARLGLYNTLSGLILVYVATQLAMTVYILEGFFAQIPQDLFDAARMDGYSDFEIFWRITLPIGMPAIFTTVIAQLHHPVERVPLRRRAADRRRQAHAAARHHAFHGRPPARRRHDRHRADDRHRCRSSCIYAFFSETMIKGMTAGAVR